MHPPSLLLFLGFCIVGQSIVLRQVQVITRHGARTPFQDLPRSNYVWNCRLSENSRPDYNQMAQEDVSRVYRKRYIRNREILPGNCSLGQLTYNGYAEHLDLGRSFRKTYVEQFHFLNETFNANEFFVRSTDSPRTLASAQSQLLGFYPPSTRRHSASVIDIFTIEPPNENLVTNMRCPKLVKMCTEIGQSTQWTKQEATLNPLKNQLQNLWNVSSLPWWIGLYDSFYSRSYQNVSLPDGITTDMVNQIVNLVVWELNYLYGSPNVAKLGIGTFLLELVNHMQNVANGQTNPKWIFYSAHDTTLALVLSSLKSLEGTGWPSYAAHLLFELWEDDFDNFYVHVIYNDQDIVIPGCETAYCELETFIDICSKHTITPEEWRTECGLQNSLPMRELNVDIGPANLAQYFC